MKRRDVLPLLGGAVAVWPLAARAQQKAMPVVGFLSGTTLETHLHNVAALLQGLNDTGHVEGRNVAIEYRWAEGRFDRLPALVADLVARKVDFILANGLFALTAAKDATRTIPIVTVGGTDLVAAGFVASFARPGGNITGVAWFFAR